MKLLVTYLKLGFLLILLVANAIAFHFYNKPVAKMNLERIPESSIFVCTVNFKNISGKLLNELLFNSGDFEDEVITKTERNLVSRNISYDINPFGLISYFIFPFENKMLQGLSFNLNDNHSLAEIMESEGRVFTDIDGTKIYCGEKNTLVLYENDAVLLLDKINKADAEAIFMKHLVNEDLASEFHIGDDFQLIFSDQVFNETIFSPYLRLVPSFADKLILSGNFEKGKINLTGSCRLESGKRIRKVNKFRKIIRKEIEAKNLIAGITGVSFDTLFRSSFTDIFNIGADSSGKLKQIIESELYGLQYSLNEINFNIGYSSIDLDFVNGNWFNPEFTSYISLYSKNKNIPHEQLKVNTFLKEYPDDVGRKLLLNTYTDQQVETAGFLYLNIKRLFDESDMNFIVRNFIDPLVIFNDVLLNVTGTGNNAIDFEGDLQMLDTEMHSLLQLRMLFKNISSLI